MLDTIYLVASAVGIASVLLWYGIGDAGDRGSALPPPLGPDRPDWAFAETYWEARAKFLAAAAAAGAELHALEVMPSYFIDVAVLAGAGPGIVIHSSGVHGVEGFAGSAIQVALLRKLAADEAGDSSGNAPTVVLVHAVNPVGMAHYRRFNENNVDLNRNALLPEDRAEVISRDPNVAGYFDFSDFLNPARPPSLVDAYLRIPAIAVYNIAAYGMLHLKRALVAAQYSFQAGIFYGGTELQSSHVLLWAFLERFQNVKPGGRVTWVDVHTGIGSSGKDTLMVAGPEGFAEVLKWFPGAGDVHCDQGGQQTDVGAGYDLTRGLIEELFKHRFTGSTGGQLAHQLHFTQEFGTVPGFLVVRAMLLENQAFHHAPAQHGYWSEFSRDAFYVRTSAWKAAVLARGVAVAEQAIQRSALAHA